MSVILLIIILGVLIFVHELGHFLIAKKSGVRVDEFAIGFPPTLWSRVKNGTKYALNLIPIGGYVKIFGENPDQESLDANRSDSFLNKSKLTQASVLVGGVLFNIIFAWILLSTSFMFGFPAIVTDKNQSDISEPIVVITNVLSDSPAEKAGLQPADKIISISNENTSIEISEMSIGNIQKIISSEDSKHVTLNIIRNSEELKIVVPTALGIIDDKPAIGISMEKIGVLKLSFFKAISEAYVITGQLIKDIFVGLFTLIGQAFSGKASFDSIAGPVGIVGLVDSAKYFGWSYLLSFTAFISINLAVLNIMPFPALDGGRLLILLIESVSRRRIKPMIVNGINAAGFAILILLMIAVTVNDIVNLL